MHIMQNETICSTMSFVNKRKVTCEYMACMTESDVLYTLQFNA